MVVDLPSWWTQWVGRPKFRLGHSVVQGVNVARLTQVSYVHRLSVGVWNLLSVVCGQHVVDSAT